MYFSLAKKGEREIKSPFFHVKREQAPSAPSFFLPHQRHRKQEMESWSVTERGNGVMAGADELAVRLGSGVQFVVSQLAELKL